MQSDAVYVHDLCQDPSDFCLVTQQYEVVIFNNESFKRINTFGNWGETLWRLLKPGGYATIVGHKSLVSEREIRLHLHEWFTNVKITEKDDVYECVAQKKDTATLKHNWALQKGVFNMPFSARHDQYTNFGPYSQLVESEFLKMIDRPGYAAIACCNATIAISVLAEAYHYVTDWYVQRDTFWSQIENALSESKVVPMRKDGKCGPEKRLYNGGLWVTSCFGMMDVSTQREYLEKAPVVLFDHAYTVEPNQCEIGDGAVFSMHETKPLGCGEGGIIVVPEEMEDHVRRLCNFGPPRRRGTNAKMSESSAFNLLQWWRRWKQVEPRFMRLVKDLKDLVKRSKVSWMYEFYGAVPAAFAVKGKPYDIKEVQKHTKLPLRRYYEPVDGGKVAEGVLVMPIKPEVSVKEYKNVLKNAFGV